MRKLLKVLIAYCTCMYSIGTISSMAFTDPGAGIFLPEEAVISALNQAPTVTAAPSAYENVAISRVTDYVNVRQEPNTSSGIVGKIYNNCAATILETVDGEGGKWYRMESGSVTGYIKAQFFITGAEAEAIAREVGTEYATVINVTSLRLRSAPNLDSDTLTLLSSGAKYQVLGEEGGFAKIAVDTDLEGYVSKDYIQTAVEFKQAISLEEEAAKQAEDAKLAEDAKEAIRQLDAAKIADAQQSNQNTVKNVAPKNDDTGSEGPSVNNPDGSAGGGGAPGEAETKSASELYGPGGSASTEVVSATRNAVVAYAKQFLGNPYVYGGTSLTEGADCSGFTQGVFSHFGIATGRSSRDQADRGREISTDSVQPGDLLFYASGDYINHVALYIGGGQVIHASTPTSGIVISPANYRTPCKAVSFLD